MHFPSLETSLVRPNILVIAFFVSSLLAGCSAAAEADAIDDDIGDQAALTSGLRALLGRYSSNAPSPTFAKLNFHADSTFTARVMPGEIEIVGTFTATDSSLTLEHVEGELASRVYGTYRYALEAGALRLTRSGAEWAGWSDTLTRPESIWSNAVTAVEAEFGYGTAEIGAPAPGAECFMDEKYSYDVAGKELAWSVCGLKSEGKLAAGRRALVASEAADVIAVMNTVSIYPRRDRCDVEDAPEYDLRVTAGGQTKAYRDATYACADLPGTFVDGMSDVFITFRRLAAK